MKKVRFPDWQHTNQGERLVQRELRKTLLKYQLHHDQDLFDKAYAYIRQYLLIPFRATGHATGQPEIGTGPLLVVGI